MKRVLAMMLLIIALIVVVIVPFIIWGETRFATFSHQETGITSFLLASLELIGLVISIAIVVFILYQYIRYRRPYRLVFDAFSNESTLFKNNDKPLNLSILAKEELVHQFKMIYREIKVYKNQSDKRNQNLEVQIADELYIDEDPLGNDMRLYLSIEQIKKSGIIEDLEEVFKILTDPEDINLMNLVGEIAPKEVTPIMKFIEAIFPPHIIKTTGHLQFKSDMHGITFEFVDMGNQHNLMVRTLWKPTENTADSTEKEADYYIELLNPAMHWVAIMFWEQKLISHVPFRNRMFLGKKREKRRQARIFYLLGALYYAHANQMNTYKYFFHQLSVEHLRRASDTDPDWCLPSLYLANLYSFKMIETAAETKGEIQKKLLDEALCLYEEALKRTERKKVSIYTQHRILLDKALAEINSDDDELIEQAKKIVQDITVIQGPANLLISILIVLIVLSTYTI